MSPRAYSFWTDLASWIHSAVCRESHAYDDPQACPIGRDTPAGIELKEDYEWRAAAVLDLLGQHNRVAEAVIQAMVTKRKPERLGDELALLRKDWDARQNTYHPSTSLHRDLGKNQDNTHTAVRVINEFRSLARHDATTGLRFREIPFARMAGAENVEAVSAIVRDKLERMGLEVELRNDNLGVNPNADPRVFRVWWAKER